MLKIKKLYGFMLQGFLPLFMMTFCICLFIVLMQFLWRFIDDLVGKGLEISVIAELFLCRAHDGAAGIAFVDSAGVADALRQSRRTV